MPRPDLLLLYADEQAARTMAAYGNDQIDTPNLNRLAKESLVFDQTYVTQPVCTPSRSSLLTGLYPHTNGCTANNVPLRAEVQCLPELAGFSDHRTAHMGKWGGYSTPWPPVAMPETPSWSTPAITATSWAAISLWLRPS